MANTLWFWHHSHPQSHHPQSEQNPCRRLSILLFGYGLPYWSVCHQKVSFPLPEPFSRQLPLSPCPTIRARQCHLAHNVKALKGPWGKPQALSPCIGSRVQASRFAAYARWHGVSLSGSGGLNPLPTHSVSAKVLLPPRSGVSDRSLSLRNPGSSVTSIFVFRNLLAPSSIKKDWKFSPMLLLPILKLPQAFCLPICKVGWKLSTPLFSWASVRMVFKSFCVGFLPGGDENVLELIVVIVTQL